MKRRHKSKIIQIIIASTLLGILFLHFYAPLFITEIKNPIIGIIKGDYRTNTSSGFENNEADGKYINFKSFDQVEMSAYLTYSSLDTIKGTIILLHGIRAKKEHFYELSNKLALLGFNSIALDLRAHGQSQGAHCTFGVKEKRDISELIDILQKEENITQNIGVWGQSLGGAIGLQALAHDDRLKFGIIESTFSDFKTITNDYVSYHAGFNIRPLTNYLVGRAGEIAEFDPDEAKPLESCEKIEQPILIVHGNRDKRISINYARANFEKIASKNKTFIEIEGANHLNVWDIGGDQYFDQALQFLNENTAVDTVDTL